MAAKENNFAFIDSNNLYQSLSKDILKNGQKIYFGWRLDYRRFRIYLKDKYKVQKAFLFIGFMPGNQAMYTKLQEYGYICVFKPTLELKDGRIKGNVDAELVLHSMIEYKNYDKAVIISGDSDFGGLLSYLKNKKKKIVVVCTRDRMSKELEEVADKFIPAETLRDFLDYENKNTPPVKAEV